LQTDAELVRAVLSGEKHIFAELVRRYERPVRAVALEVLGDYHLAADVSQDTFVKAYQQLWKLRQQESFGPWLLKIAHRYALELVNQKNQSNRLEIRSSDKYETPDGQLDEEKRRLLSAVAKLPKPEKQVVMLHYFGQNDVSDVAIMLGRPVGTVTKQLSRARIRLRKILERSGK
jgi:RNA polymerase sigma-70 factor, ECF subfamily